MSWLDKLHNKFQKTKPRPVFPRLSEVFTDFRLWLAFGMGSGLSRIMPGTCGTAAALPFLFLFENMPLIFLLPILLLSFLVGVYLCSYASKKLQVHDHGGIVWDEFVGLWITFIAVPLNGQTLILGFFLFRIFDMVKPWPIRWLDRRVEGGFGIMIDDVLAGIFALLCLHLSIDVFKLG